MSKHFVSILIPLKKYNPYLGQCLDYCLKLDYPSYEIIVLPDEIFTGYDNPKIKIIPTSNIDPARKRDIGIERSVGDILAFLDDDAYPPADWLKNALKNFDDLEVAAVGGPAITPPEDKDSLRQQASGLVFASAATSGTYAYRYAKGISGRRLVDDYPSCNFLVRKSTILELGGFKTTFWPGEDTILCLEITKKLKKKIVYDPEVLVYHHRRHLFRPHLKQIANYALHRGYFVKKFPETSMRFAYFLPSIWLLTLVLGLFLSLLCLPIRIVYIVVIVLYFLIVLFNSRTKNLKLTFFVLFGIILSHIVYGANFIKGLLTDKLQK